MKREDSSLCNSLDDIRENIDKIDIELVNLIAKRSKFVSQAAQFKKITICLGSGGKTTGHRNTSACKITDHLAEGCVLAPHMLHVMGAELIEGNYVLYQGDLSTNGVGKSSGRWTLIMRHHSDCGLDLENK